MNLIPDDNVSPWRSADRLDQSSRILLWPITGLLLLAGFLLDGWAHIAVWVVLTSIWVLRYRDISHPCFWFPLIFMMYGISFYIIVYLGILSSGPEALYSTRMHLLALVAFLMGASGPALTSRVGVTTSVGLRHKQVLLLASGLFLILSLYHYGTVFSSEGLSTKQDIRRAKDDALALRLGPIYAPMALFLGLLLLRVMAEGRKGIVLITFMVVWGVLGLLITGERDILLRLLIVIGFIWNMQRARIQTTWALVSFLVLILTLPVMQAMKGLLIGSQNEMLLGVYDVFGREFKSSGRVFSTILERWPGFMFGETFLWDIQRTFAIGPLSTDNVSTSKWFNREFIGHEGAGWGFSLVGEMYLNFGWPMIVVAFAVIGRVARRLYRLQDRSGLHLVGYAVTVSIMIYSIRGDGATLIGSPLKLVLLPAFMLVVLEQYASQLARVQRK